MNEKKTKRNWCDNRQQLSVHKTSDVYVVYVTFCKSNQRKKIGSFTSVGGWRALELCSNLYMHIFNQRPNEYNFHTFAYI